ncbi:MAG: UDP-N-acetylmuramoyl-L-alanyl-D-glutamate--2,6-diaminopimelate ligase [Mariprofundaceae bacterium]|nr:UDP-N-acetylmuramoyl-L-alanyl-D-glutamate--2,6-diaminopimelate ligase [Mariprofundaceae bacterium]
MNKSMQYLKTMSQPSVQSFTSLGYDFSGADCNIQNICDDSRAVKQGDTFLCMPRSAGQSRDYIQYAIVAGASSIIYIGNDYVNSSVPCLYLSDMDEAGVFLRRYFQTEQTTTQCIGITGTDGKTSVAWILREALVKKYGQAWSSGTLGWIEDDGHIHDLGNTTPSMLTLHHLLSAADKQNIPALVMEVSSHGIDQQRIAGLHFDAGIWTTLGRDHLQDHGGFEAYASLKSRFIYDTGKHGGTVVYNHDQTNVYKHLKPADFALHAYGHGLYEHNKQADMMTWEQELPGLLRLAYQGEEVVVEDIPVGRFHAENIAAVAQILHSHYKLNLQEIAQLLCGVTAPPGRMQPVNAGIWQAFIDYAHTAEALQACLESIRPITHGRLLLVFGCGGERDREKRPAMGRIASEFADILWITSDNPRHERPEIIASEIEEGIAHPYPLEVHLQLDRKQAIADAIASMNSDDTLVIAGKGHEAYMDIQGERLPWSDMACARQLLHQKNMGQTSCI